MKKTKDHGGAAGAAAGGGGAGAWDAGAADGQDSPHLWSERRPYRWALLAELNDMTAEHPLITQDQEMRAAVHQPRLDEDNLTKGARGPSCDSLHRVRRLGGEMGWWVVRWVGGSEMGWWW